MKVTRLMPNLSIIQNQKDSSLNKVLKHFMMEGGGGGVCVYSHSGLRNTLINFLVSLSHRIVPLLVPGSAVSLKSKIYTSRSRG